MLPAFALRRGALAARGTFTPTVHLWSSLLQSPGSMTAERSALVERLQQQLLKEAGAAGWPYYRGKSSRVEPTCWALLALGASWPTARESWSDFARPHLQWLFSRQTPDGLLTDTEPALANLTAHAL